MIETIGKIILVIACLFMAGLNLWNEFSDWFNKKYQKRSDNNQPAKSITKEKQKGIVPNIIGESKFRLRTIEEENIPFHSIELEKELPEKKQINPEDELVPLDIVSNQNTIHDQRVTIDEFEMLANTLQGKIIPRDIESQVKEILQKMKGTNLLEQFTSQVKGAEGIANKILASFDNNEKNINNTGFDFSKYIRK